MAFFAFRKPRHTTEPDRAPVAADPVLMRFLTLGGATVQLRSEHVRTHYAITPWGKTRTDKAREVEGFIWECLGCGTVSDRDRYLFDAHVTSARGDANKHAGECRALPRPEVPR